MLCNIYSVVFCFNDPATTEIYTYLHTRSLRAALPISARRRARRRPDSRRPAHRVFSIWPVMACRHRESTAPEPSKICAMWWAHLKLRHGIPTGSRSEEHTSELQSLMRTSYAVFCL